MIYFARAGETRLVKIGFTAGDPRKRLKELQTGCPHKFVLLAVIEGGPTEEAGWHRDFQSHWVHGEWFTLTDDVLVAIGEATAEEFLRRPVPPAPPWAGRGPMSQTVEELFEELSRSNSPREVIPYLFLPEKAWHNFPEWKRTVYYDPKNHEIYVPWSLTGMTEEAAMMACSWDGTGVVWGQNHLYLPASWVVKRHPEMRESCRRVAATVRAAHTVK